jgi:hypothetical protein
MKNQIRLMTERGNLHQILTHFSLKTPNCKPLLIEGRSLGLMKISMPFVIVIIGFIFSIIICFGEWLLMKPSNIDANNIDNLIDNAKDELRKNVFAFKGLISVKQDQPPSTWLDDFVIQLNNKTANKTN